MTVVPFFMSSNIGYLAARRAPWLARWSARALPSRRIWVRGDAAGEEAAEGGRFLLERFQVRGVDLVAPLHLPRHELAVGVDRDAPRAARLGFLQTTRIRALYSATLLVVWPMPSPISASVAAVRVGHEDADARRAGVALAGAVHMKRMSSMAL